MVVHDGVVGEIYIHGTIVVRRAGWCQRRGGKG